MPRLFPGAARTASPALLSTARVSARTLSPQAPRPRQSAPVAAGGEGARAGREWGAGASGGPAGPPLDPAREEMCAVVDADNVVVGAATRKELVANRMRGRGSYVLLFDRRGRLFVSRRSERKDVYPGRLDVVISGVVGAGESYEEAAARELLEEVGVAPPRLVPLATFPFEDPTCRVWARAFAAVADGPVRLLDGEVAWGEFLPLDHVRRMAQGEGGAGFTPVGLQVLSLLSDADVDGVWRGGAQGG